MFVVCNMKIKAETRLWRVHTSLIFFVLSAFDLYVVTAETNLLNIFTSNGYLFES